MTIQEANEVKRLHYLSSFYHFTKFGLGYSLMTPHTHGPICKALEAETKRKLITVPRGTFKSSIATESFPMWLLERNPNLRILIDSEKYDNSKNFLRAIKSHYQMNQEFRNVFGDRYTAAPLWNEGEIILPTRTVPKKEPSIACSGIGAGKTSQHYDVIIADDLCSYVNTKNPEVAAKVLDHYKLYQSLLDPGGIIVVIGTRYSELDVIGFIIENELGIENQDLRVLKQLYG